MLSMYMASKLTTRPAVIRALSSGLNCIDIFAQTDKGIETLEGFLVSKTFFNLPYHGHVYLHLKSRVSQQTRKVSRKRAVTSSLSFELDAASFHWESFLS